MVFRSTLFTPASSLSMMQKALDGEADAVTLDLEDAVAAKQKETARDNIRTILETTGDKSPTVGVRINQLESGGLLDLDSLRDVTSLEYIVLPMVESPTDVKALSDALKAREIDVGICATIESPLGLEHAVEIAHTPGLIGMGFGGEDFTAEVGAIRTVRGEEISYARQRVVMAAAVGSVPATDTVYTTITDNDSLRDDAETALQFGFTGKSAIHPTQIPVINDVFTPSKSDVAYASRIADQYEEAESNAVEVDGQMIDRPLYLRAMATLERARAAELSELE